MYLIRRYYVKQNYRSRENQHNLLKKYLNRLNMILAVFIQFKLERSLHYESFKTQSVLF